MENLSNEIWVDIKGYEGHYQISNLGRIISLKNNKKTLRSQHLAKGYPSVKLMLNGKYRMFTTHQLMAICFLNHELCGHRKVVNHKDGNRSNNKISNLEIVSHRANTTTCFRSDRNKLSSEYVGVFFCKSHNAWVSRIQVRGKNIHLGNYKEELQASEAYQIAISNIDNPSYFESIKTVKSSKYKGVSYRKDNMKWRAFYNVDKKTKTIGCFNTEEEAYNALQDFINKPSTETVR